MRTVVAVDDLHSVEGGEQAARHRGISRGRSLLAMVVTIWPVSGQRPALHGRAVSPNMRCAEKLAGHVLGAELVAVMQLHAGAELELDGPVVDPAAIRWRGPA